MNNLIPKNIRKSKLEFWRGIGLVEILIVLLWVGLTTLFIIGLPMSTIMKIGFSILFALISIPLIITIMPGVKGWYALVLIFKYKSQNKKYSQFNSKSNTGFLVPYDCVENDFIKTQKINGKSHYIGGIQIIGYNISLLNPETQMLKISDLHDFFKNTDFEISLLKLDLPMNFNDSISFYVAKEKELKKLYQLGNLTKQEYEARKFGLYSYINEMYGNTINLEGNFKINRSFFLFVYAKTIDELNLRIEQTTERLYKGGFRPNKLDGYDLVKTIKLIFNPYDKPITKEEYESGKNNLEDILAFKEFRINHNHFKADELFYAIHGVYDYPIFPKNGWGADLATAEQTMIWNINPIDTQSFKKALNKAINNTRTKQFMTKSNVDKSENNYQLEAYENLVESINGAHERVNNVDILFLNYGLNLKTLRQAENRLKILLKDLNIKVDKLTYRQLEAYSALLPQLTDPLMSKIGREMPSESLANSFPLLNGGVYDEKGLYLGVNTTGDTILFDQFKLDDKRKNHNKIIIGTSGSGKSYTTKKEISYHLNLGRTVIAIDPEREYKNICQFYNGQWVDTGDATVGRINPLQVLDNNFRENNDNLKIELKEEKAMEEFNEAPVSNHLRLLDQWFKTLYKEMTERERRILINQIQMTYKTFRINNQTNISELANEQFPTFNDVYKTINNSLAINSNDAILNTLKEIIYYDFMNDGQYKQLWNGHTTLNLKSNFVVYDVWTLFDQDIPKITAAQLHLVLAFVKAEVKRNRFKNNNEIIIVIDEAHLAIDKDNPVALNFMYQMVKRIRKYKGAIIITTQNWNDFIGTEEIKKKTTAMINNTQYSMIMNLAPSDLKDVCEVYRAYGGLSPQEQDYIARAQKGEMILLISGFDRHCLRIEVSKAEELSFENLPFKMPKLSWTSSKQQKKVMKKDIPETNTNNKITGLEHMEYKDEWQFEIDKSKQPHSLKGDVTNGKK
ncbi:Mbov_0397 family ICE element conjugal transfer ATPase [Spiroplasma sp. DGKH1]|uniref:Mbov_0397 family ICE element conjugal transfer ATPase n=1 Tax=Spiroplasma sp. DGKH1 TaxID=3050074 RepID=UPI0034C6CA15